MNTGDTILVDMLAIMHTAIGALLTSKGVVTEEEWELNFYAIVKRVAEKHHLKLSDYSEWLEGRATK